MGICICGQTNDVVSSKKIVPVAQSQSKQAETKFQQIEETQVQENSFQLNKNTQKLKNSQDVNFTGNMDEQRQQKIDIGVEKQQQMIKSDILDFWKEQKKITLKHFPSEAVILQKEKAFEIKDNLSYQEFNKQQNILLEQKSGSSELKIIEQGDISLDSVKKSEIIFYEQSENKNEKTICLPQQQIEVQQDFLLKQQNCCDVSEQEFKEQSISSINYYSDYKIESEQKEWKIEGSSHKSNSNSEIIIIQSQQFEKQQEIPFENNENDLPGVKLFIQQSKSSINYQSDYEKESQQKGEKLEGLSQNSNNNSQIIIIQSQQFDKQQEIPLEKNRYDVPEAKLFIQQSKSSIYYQSDYEKESEQKIEGSLHKSNKNSQISINSQQFDIQQEIPLENNVCDVSEAKLFSQQSKSSVNYESDYEKESELQWGKIEEKPYNFGGQQDFSSKLKSSKNSSQLLLTKNSKISINIRSDQEYEGQGITIGEKALENQNERQLVSTIKNFVQEPIYQEKAIITLLEELIFENDLNMTFLNELSLAIQKSINEILFLKSDSGMVIIQLILAYIPSFEIITYLLKENSMSIKQLKLIRFDLLQKLKPSKNPVNQIQEQIKFLQELQKFVNVENFVKSFEIEFIKMEDKALKQNYLNNFNIFTDLTIREQLKFLKQVNLLLMTNGYGDQFSDIYKLAKQNLDFQNLKISKTIPLGKSNVNSIDKIILQELNFNIFHQVAIERKWNLFLQYSNPYYQQPNVSQITPFMILIQKAPLKVIIEYIQNYPEQLDQGIKYHTLNGLNLIHCLSMNKEATVNHEIDLNIIIQDFVKYGLNRLLIQAYNDQIPLVFYLDYQKNNSQKMIAFLSQYKKEEFNLEKQRDLSIAMWQKRDNIIKTIKKQRSKKKKSEQLIDENENLSMRFYHQYIQLAKVIIKRNFTVRIPWIIHYGFCSTQYQSNTGYGQNTLVNIMIRNSQFEQVKAQLKLFHEFSLSKEMQKHNQSSNYQADYLSKLLSLKLELRKNFNKQINQQINELIVETINQQPDILIKPIFYDNFHSQDLQNKNKLDKYHTIYIFLLELNDSYLNKNCLNKTLIFENNWNICIKILEQLFKLQLISKLNDKVSLSLFSYIQKECDKNQIYNHLIKSLKVREQKKIRLADKQLFEAILNLKNYQLINKMHLNSATFCQQFAFLKEFQTEQLLRKLWFMKEKIDFTQLNCNLSYLSGKIIFVKSIKPEQYEIFYDWQIVGIKFKIIDYSQIFKKNENFKQKVITYQLKQRLQSIFLALSIYPESFNDFKNKLSKENKEQTNLYYFLLRNLPLKDILINDSYESLKFCIETFDYSRMQLVNMLASAYFLGQTDQYYGKGKGYDEQQIQQFQQNLSKLLQFLDKNCKFYTEEMEELKEWIEFAPYPYFLKFITLSIFNQLRKSIAYLTFVDKLPNISVYHYIQMSQDINIRKIILKDYLKKVGYNLENDRYLLKISLLNPSLAEIALRYYEQSLKMSKDEFYSLYCFNKNLQTLLIIIFQDNPILVINFLIENQNFLTLTPAKFVYFYQLALQNKNIQLLNKLLYYDETLFIQKDFCVNRLGYGFSLFTHVMCDLINYQKALIYPSCSVLNFFQYQQYLQNITADSSHLIYHLLSCFQSGQYEKVELIIKKIGNFSSFDNQTQFVRLFERTLKVKLIEQIDVLEYIFDDSVESERDNNFVKQLKLNQFFTFQEPYNIVKLQIKQKRESRILLEEAKEKLATSLSFSDLNLTQLQITRKEDQKFYQLKYSQEQAYSKQNQNRFVLFASLEGYKSDHSKCFNMISQWATYETLSSLSPFYEFYEAFLIAPRKKKIKMCTEIKWLLLHLFQSKRMHFPNIVKYQKEFMQLLSANYCQAASFIKLNGKQIEIKVSFQNIIPQLQEQFLKDLILDQQIYIPTNQDLEQIIVQLKIQNQKLLPILKQAFKGLSGFIFNKSTLFYAKKQVNLLPQATYDLEKIDKIKFKIFEKRQIIFSKHINSVRNDLRILNSSQVFLIFGKHEHINNIPSFSYENLLLALVSGNLSTITFVLNLHKNPRKLAFEQNIFQLLISNSYNESLILNFYNQFIREINTKPSQGLLFLDKVPLLYYIVLNKRKDLFEKCYLKLINDIFGENSIHDIVKQQLLEAPFIDGFNILSIALKRKSYFILDYCSGIITLKHLENVDHIDFQLIEKISTQAFHEISLCNQFYKLYAQYLPLCQTKTLVQEYQITSNICIRDYLIKQLLILEKACLNQIFNLGGNFIFKNPVLSIEFSANQWETLENYQYDFKLLSKVLQQYRQYDGKLRLSKKLILLVLEKCQNYRILDSPILGDLIETNPKLCLRKIMPFNFTLYLAVIFSKYLRNSKELKEFIYQQIELTQQQCNPKQLSSQNFLQPNVLYALQLLFCIQQDQYDEFVIEKMNIKTISTIYDFLNDENDNDKPRLSFQAKDFLNSLLKRKTTLKNPDVFIQIIENEKTVQKAILKGILYTKAINFNIENFFDRLKQQKIQLQNFSEFCRITITNDSSKKIKYNQYSFSIPLQFQNNSCYIEDSQINMIIPILQMMNYQINIDTELQQFEQQQEKWENIDFSSITTVDFKEIILTEKVNIIEKCIFFEHLMQPLKRVGFFDIDDVSAPHQHEQVTSLHQTDQPQDQQSQQLPENRNYQSVHQKKKMKEDFQFMLELLPDNTYQVRQQRGDKIEKKIIFVEFYHFVQPKVVLNLVKLNEKEYKTKYNQQTVITIVIADFYRYYLFLSNIIENRPVQQWEVTFPFYILENNFVYEKSLFSTYNIQYIQTKLYKYVKKVEKGKSEDVGKIEWRINAISFLEVLVARLVELKQQLDIYSIIDEILDWDTLIFILHQILYNNLVKAKRVMKVISGVYIEFNEQPNKSNCDWVKLKGLDTIFRFGNTNYSVYNHILIVRLNIVVIQQQFLKQQQFEVEQTLERKPFGLINPRLQGYFHKIINENDFYIQIFNPEQLVQYLFNKLDIDRCLLKYSKKISKILSKQITLSIEHKSLFEIFDDKIINFKKEQSSEKRLESAESVWFVLNKLNDYVQNDLFTNIYDQLMSENFRQTINIQLAKMIEALKEIIPLRDILNSNSRKLNLEQKQETLQYVNNFMSLKGQYYFGFQVEKQYYLNNFKLGDIFLLSYSGYSGCDDFQLVHNQTEGKLKLLKLQSSKNKILTLNEIIEKQNYYQKIKESTDEIQVINYEMLNHIILFSSIWPSDRIFNQNILNVFFTDTEGHLYFCNEPKLMQAMNQVFGQEENYIQNNLFDQILGPGLISSSQDISLTSLVQRFPDQINFSFSCKNQMKKQKQKEYVYIHLNDEEFKVDLIPLPQVSIACYFDTNPQIKLLQKQFIDFLQNNEELSNISLEFDDLFDDDPNTYLKTMLTGFNIFQEFEAGYQRFKECQYYPKINNSLQFLFKIESIVNLKVDFIRSNIKKIQFIYEKTYGNTKQLIVFQEECLKLFTLIDVDGITTVPQSYQITQFFYDLIVQHEKFNLTNFFCGNKSQFQIFIPIDYQNKDCVVIADIILITKYMFKLIELQVPQVQIKVNIQSENNLEKNLIKHTIYQFHQDDQLIINYNSFSDFNLTDFFLDYLNNKSSFKWDKYNNEIQYIGPQIIFERILLDPQQLLSNMEIQSEIDIQLYQFGKQQISKIDNLDPNIFQEAFLIFKVNGVYIKMTSIISCQNQKLLSYYSQQSSEQKICNSIYLLIYNLNENKDISVQLKDIRITVQQDFNIQSTNLGQILQLQGLKDIIRLEGTLITNGIFLLEIFSSRSLFLTFSSDMYEFSVVQKDKKLNVTLEFITQNTQDLSKTVHCQVQINEKILKVKTDKKQIILKSSLLQNILEANLNNRATYNVKNFDSENIFSAKMQAGNIITRLTKIQFELASYAGDIRNDKFEFQDSFNNRVLNFYYSSVVFIHSLYPSIQYFPETERDEVGLNLIWCPVVKGIYKLYIDEIQINGQFIVLAVEPDLDNSQIEFPEVFGSFSSYYENFTLTFQLKDRYGNLYSDIEEKVRSSALFQIKMRKEVCHLKTIFSDLNNYGHINVDLSFEPLNLESTEIEVEVDFLLNQKIKTTKKVKISGLALEKRRKGLLQEISSTFKTYQTSLTIRRMNFLEDLLELTDKKLNIQFKIVFQDEPGIDVGGLKREFYDMIGNILKDDKYRFFSPVQGNPDQYFLHKNFNKLKNKERYALLFGKLIANSIGNKELIGIDIISPFWKVVYNEKIQFEDLQIILDKETYENYNGLRSLSNEIIESLCLDFTYQVDNKTIELITNGSKTEVTKKNLKEYLNSTAEYVICKQFETIYKSFREGFQSVIDIATCKKWLKPNETSVLTQGLTGIKPEILLTKITYQGGQASHKSYFEMYITQANQQTLKGMLKFVTGTSAIPFDQSSYFITVKFQSTLHIEKLPQAHTCFNSIDVPLYQNYAQLKQQLDIAFTIGLEGGFGFV